MDLCREMVARRSHRWLHRLRGTALNSLMEKTANPGAIWKWHTPCSHVICALIATWWMRGNRGQTRGDELCGWTRFDVSNCARIQRRETKSEKCSRSLEIPITESPNYIESSSLDNKNSLVATFFNVMRVVTIHFAANYSSIAHLFA